MHTKNIRDSLYWAYEIDSIYYLAGIQGIDIIDCLVYIPSN